MLTFMTLFEDDFVSYFQGNLRLCFVVSQIFSTPNHYLWLEYFRIHHSSTTQTMEDWHSTCGNNSIPWARFTVSPSKLFCASSISYYPNLPIKKHILILKAKHTDKTFDKVRAWISFPVLLGHFHHNCFSISHF
jgi:hypothetical protein